MRIPLFAGLLCSVALSLPAAAQKGAPARPQEIAPGIFQIGGVRLEQGNRTLTFPAAVNLDKGMLEYLLVNKNGPTHESLLVADFSPADLHVAMLLLGVKESGKSSAAAPGQITEEYLKKAPPLTGDNIAISVNWKDKVGAEKSVAVEDWLWRADTQKPVDRGPWIYSGSYFDTTGIFSATPEGLFAALVTNPSALINNPRPGHDSDQVWSVNEKAVPPTETPVTVQIKLLTPPPVAETK